MKVFLINPPAANGIKVVREGRCMQRKGAWTTIWPPISLATMAGILQAEAVEIRFCDCVAEEIDCKALRLKVAKFKPDLAVINTATVSIDSDLTCASLVKEAHPQSKTLAFGLHVTALPEECLLMQSDLDYIIRGEPEFCFWEFIRCLKQGQGLSQIAGLSYRDNAGICHNKSRGFKEDLNCLPDPAWEFINLKNYTMPFSNQPFLLVTTSKGCAHRCIFCPSKPFYGSRLRLRQAERAVDEMASAKQRFGVRQFLIWSESFTEDRSYVINFCSQIIKRGLNIAWVCNSRVDKVDLDLLKIMQKAGCWMIGYGVESGSQKILDNARKDVTVAQIEQAINWTKQAGIEVTAHLIFGLPGETQQTAYETINWLKKLRIDFIQAYCAVPWPSSPLYSIAKENNWLTSRDWSLFEQNYSLLDIGTIKPRQVESLRRKAFWKFYFSPRIILKILGRIKTPSDLKSFINMLKEFITWF